MTHYKFPSREYYEGFHRGVIASIDLVRGKETRYNITDEIGGETKAQIFQEELKIYLQQFKNHRLQLESEEKSRIQRVKKEHKKK